MRWFGLSDVALPGLVHHHTHEHTHILKNIYIFIRVIMNHQGHNNIRSGIVWVQTGHSTCTCTATLHVIEPRAHQKFESYKK